MTTAARRAVTELHADRVAMDGETEEVLGTARHAAVFARSCFVSGTATSSHISTAHVPRGRCAPRSWACTERVPHAMGSCRAMRRMVQVVAHMPILCCSSGAPP
jgi:hypothetical protein